MSPTTSATRIVPEPTRATPTAAHLLLAFVAGFIAVLAVQQSLRALLVATGAASGTTYALDPAAVTGVPRVLGRAFWGGVWGIVFALVEPRVPRQPGYAIWVAALAFGALLPSLFTWFIVAPMRGQPVLAGGDPARLVVTLVTNAAWGVGTAAFYLLLRHISRR